MHELELESGGGRGHGEMVPILKQSTRLKKKYVVRFFYGGNVR